MPQSATQQLSSDRDAAAGAAGAAAHTSPGLSGPPVWAAGTVIAPDPDVDGRALVTNAVTGGRLGLGRGALVDLVGGRPRTATPAVLREHGLAADAGTGPADGAGLPDDPGLAMWREREWSYALDSYLWSRRTSFRDDGDDYRDRQAELLGDFLERDGPPPGPRRVAAEHPLRAPRPLPERPVGEVLRRRVTARTLPDREIALADLSDVLAHGLAGASRHRDPDPAQPHRYLYSYGCAFDYYVTAYRVAGLEPGVHLYQPETHTLGPVSTGWDPDLLRAECQRVFIGQPQVLGAAATVFVVGDFRRYQWRYRHERAMRNLYFDAARVANGLILAATAIDLRNWITPAVRDAAATELLGLIPVDTQVLYTVTVG